MTKRITTVAMLALCLIGLTRIYAVSDKQELTSHKTTSTNIDPDMAIPEPVDLGLSVLWASWNVGANAPEQDGDYFAWGEVEKKNYYDWATYSLCQGKENTCEDLDEISGTKYDVAHVKWGGKWRMPTQAEVKELCNRCNTTWTSVNGRYGIELHRKVNGKDRSIFLPASGFNFEGSIHNLGNGRGALMFGGYWSGTQRNLRAGRSLALVFMAEKEKPTRPGWNDNSRALGLSVRPVMDK